MGVEYQNHHSIRRSRSSTSTCLAPRDEPLPLVDPVLPLHRKAGRLRPRPLTALIGASLNPLASWYSAGTTVSSIVRHATWPITFQTVTSTMARSCGWSGLPVGYVAGRS